MAVFMAVPIATVHEDDSAPLWQHDIRTPWQVFAMKAESVAKPVKQTAHDDLRLGILPPNAGHHVAAFCRGNDVRHSLT